MKTLPSGRRRACRPGLRKPAGFTIVELLVVLAIIAVLVTLLLPAVQSVRETARRAQCGNNLKQLAAACLQHEQANGFYPSGGWGCYWGGDPDRGFGPEQPGGWIYNILPYIEQSALWARGAGQPAAQKEIASKLVFETPLPLLNCPSRRPSQLYPCAGSFTVYNTAATPTAAKTDYCANLGGSPTASFSPAYYNGPSDNTDTSAPIPTPPQAPAPNPWASHPGNHSYSTGSNGRITMQASRTGVMYLLSRVTPAHVVDGTTNTYLVGEKYLRSDHYTSGAPTRDNRGMYQGEDLDNSCWAADGTNDTRPRQDAPGLNSDTWFGSPHRYSFHAAFCDGSVRPVSYEVDAATHKRLGNRRDRDVIQGDY